MTRKKLYDHITSTDWRGIATKIKDFKKKNQRTKTKGINK